MKPRAQPTALSDLVVHLGTLGRFEATRALRKVKAHNPLFLYKFQPPTSRSIRGIVEESKIWLSDLQAFNDPFDTSAEVNFNGTAEERVTYLYKLAKRNGCSDGDALFFAQTNLHQKNGPLFQSGLNRHVGRFGITCFATSSDGRAGHAARNILMWSHYGMSHTGVCFQFHVPRSPETFVFALPVEYNDEFIRINWTQRDNVEPLLSAMITRKAMAWAYEREYRIVKIDGASTTLDFRPAALTGIVFGLRAPNDLVQQVVEHCKVRAAKGWPAVRMFRASPMAGHYRLRLKRATDLEARCTR
jgi:hypothetical protein